MKSKSTPVWFLIAAALAATIWLLNHLFQPAAPGEKPVFAGLSASRVTSLQIIPAGGREISVTRTNLGWRLEQPLAYPAQATAIDGLLDALEKLTPTTTFSAAELSGRKNAEAEFGFDHPQFKLDVAAGGQEWHLLVGNQTAPGDGVYVRVVGAPGVSLTETTWLQFLPQSAAAWRDTALVDMPEVVDWLVITNGTQTIELRRDATNHLWRLLRPLQARANSLRIATALEHLRGATVSRFVTDDPKADPATYGLDPAALDVWLGSGTNLLTAVHAGKEAGTGGVFARREGWPSIVTLPRDALADWQGAVSDFRDPNLLEFTAPLAEIEMHQEDGTYTNNYTLQLAAQHGTTNWVMAGEQFATDPAQISTLIKTLAGLHIVDFVQDAVTPARLQSYGLAKPTHQITLRSVVGDTNHVIVQFQLGATSTNNTVFVKRSDEDFVYALSLHDFNQLSLPGDFFRDHRLWSFSEANVASVTLHQNGKLRQMLRTGTNEWSLAPGSQGMINPFAVEETVLGLGRKFSDTEDLGITTNSLSVAVELKSGEKYAVTFGKAVNVPPKNATTALAVVTLDGERWAFVFPPDLCPNVSDYLTIPANAP